jgi:hypothetical protein
LIIINDSSLRIGVDTISICDIREIYLHPQIIKVIGITIVGVGAIILTTGIVAFCFGSYALCYGLIKGIQDSVIVGFGFITLVGIPTIGSGGITAAGGCIIYEYERKFEIINCEIKITKNYSNSKVIDK